MPEVVESILCALSLSAILLTPHPSFRFSMIFRPHHPLAQAFCSLVFLLFFAGAVSGASWLPITDEERASTECPFDPDAGAEVLYKSMELDDEDPSNSYRHYYLRMKIYNEKGAESVGKYRMVYHTGSSKLGRHSARIVRADGSIEEVEKSEFYNENLKADRTSSIRAKSFSFPDLNPGDIVDFQYRIDLHEYYYSPELFLTFQERWPLRRARVRVRPATWVEGMGFIKWMTSKCNAKGMVRKSNGFYELDIGNFAANNDEPNQPPEKTNVAWLLFYMSPNGKTGDAYWKMESGKLHKKMESSTKAGKETKAVIQKILAGISEDEKKLRAIYRYCVSDITNSLHGRPGQLTPEERKEIKSDMSAEKVLAQGYGNSKNINTVFCALARAAGFDARVAAVNSRTGYRFSKVLASINTTLKRRCVAIPDGDSWRFFDPGGKYLLFGRLDWQAQGVAALISDKKKALIHPIPFSKAADTVETNKAKLSLDEDGSLSGQVEFELTGHVGVEMKRDLDGKSPQKRRDMIRDALAEYWPGAAFDSIEISNVTNPFKPIRVTFELVSYPYAEIVGDRMFITVNAFRKSAEPEFPESQRTSDIFFDYARSENEEVEIRLPEGFELEQASAPRPFKIDGVIEYAPKLAIRKNSNTLIYSKAFSVEGTNFPVAHYKSVKSLYDEKHKQDQHTITLKRKSSEVSSL